MLNTERFSDRVSNYVKYRPSYPEDAISWIFSKCENPNKKIFADIGSGTGIFSGLLIPFAEKIYCVEPNFKMRTSAEKSLCKFKNFISINGTAENTKIDQKVDYITVAQAFHWFDIEKAKIEFKRILNDGGYIFLIWNLRMKNTEFLLAYENELLKSSDEYRKVSKNNKVDDKIIEEFIPKDFSMKSFNFYQEVNWNEFTGRHNSSSYAPKEDLKENVDLLENIKKVFDHYSKNGLIRYNYETKVYCGRLA